MGLPPPANVLMGLAARDAYRTHAVCQVLRLRVNRMPEVTVGDGVRKGAQTLCLWVPHGPLSALPCDEAPPCPHPGGTPGSHPARPGGAATEQAH